MEAVNMNKGMRRVDFSRFNVDFTDLTDADLRQLMRKSEGYEEVLAPKLAACYSLHGAATLIGACRVELRKRRMSGKVSRSRDADAILAQQPVCPVMTSKGTDMTTTKGTVIAHARANVVIQPDEIKDKLSCIKRKFATRASALLRVEVKNDRQVLKSAIQSMPVEVKALDNTVGCYTLVGAYKGLDLTRKDAVYNATVEAPMDIVANGTQAMYFKAPPKILDCLQPIPVGQGERAVKMLLPVKARKIQMPVATAERDAKAQIEKLLTVVPGMKGGPGKYSASHMDGIPLSGSWRNKFNHVTDIKVTDAKVYFIEETDPIAVNAIRTILTNKGNVCGIFYRAKKPLMYKVLEKHATLNRGVITQVNSSFCMPASVWPTCGKKVKTCLIDFRDPDPPVGKSKLAVIDEARAIHNIRAERARQFTYVQMYIDYRALVFPEKDRGDNNIQLMNPSGTWTDGEKYYASPRMGFGYAWYVTGAGDFDGVAMANSIACAIYHRIQYVFLPIPQRTYGKAQVHLKPIYNFCVESMKNRMPYVTLGDESAVVDYYSEEEYLQLRTALGAVSISRQLDQVRDVTEAVRTLDQLDEEFLTEADNDKQEGESLDTYEV